MIDSNNEIKPRTVYLLKRTDKEKDDGTDLYVGSTSQTLKQILYEHRNSVEKCNSKLYTRMREIGINSWEMVPLLSFTCDKKTILEFERQWCEAIGTDLNMILAINTEEEKKEHNAKYYKSNKESIKQKIAECRKSNKQNKVYHCSVCEKSFESNWLLKRHFNSLIHQYVYLNSLD